MRSKLDLEVLLLEPDHEHFDHLVRPQPIHGARRLFGGGIAVEGSVDLDAQILLLVGEADRCPLGLGQQRAIPGPPYHQRDQVPSLRWVAISSSRERSWPANSSMADVLRTESSVPRMESGVVASSSRTK